MNTYSPIPETLHVSSKSGTLEISFTDTESQAPAVISIPNTAKKDFMNMTMREYAINVAESVIEELSFSGALSDEEEYILTQDGFLEELVDEMISDGILHDAIQKSIQIKVVDELSRRLEAIRERE